MIVIGCSLSPTVIIYTVYKILGGSYVLYSIAKVN